MWLVEKKVNLHKNIIIFITFIWLHDLYSLYLQVQTLMNASFKINLSWVILDEICQELHIFNCASLKPMRKKVVCVCDKMLAHF